MRKLQLFILFLIISLGCVEEEMNIGFKPNEKTTIKFKISNCSNPKGYSLIYFQTLPVHETKQFINFNSDTTFFHEIGLNHPLYASLGDTKDFINLFVIPNDTLIISIDYQEEKSLKEIVKFEGTTGKISDYLTRIRKHSYSTPHEKDSPETFNKMVDSFYSNEFTKLDSLNNIKFLPNWFANIEKVNISHERDKRKFSQYYERVLWYNQYIQKGEEFRNSFDLSNMEYYWLFNTFNLLASFRADTFDILLQQKNRTTDIGRLYVNDNIRNLKNRIPETVMSYFIASRLSSYFSKRNLNNLSSSEFNSHVKLIDEFIESNGHLITDTSILHFVLNEKDRMLEEYKNRNLLTKGDVAPNFYLSDKNGKLIKLSDFKNKIVLLNFWGTYCSPCIESIPDKNKFVKNYNSEHFELVNIIVDSNYDRWNEIIIEYNFKGVHLVCKGNWSEILKSKYNISTIPHYTLVDKDGLIIENNIKDSLELFLSKHI